MTNLRRILRYFRHHVGDMMLSLLAMTGVAVLTAAAMWLLKQVVDKALNSGDLEALQTVVLLVLLFYLGKAALAYFHDYLTAKVGQAIIQQIRDEVFGHIHTLSMDFFTHTDSARLISRLTNDAQLLQNALTKIPVMIVRDGLTILFLTGFLFYLHWKFALLAMIILPISGGLIARFGKKLRRTGREGQQKMSDLYVMIQESITGVSVVKAFQQEQYEIDRFKKENSRFFDISLKLAKVEAASSPVMEFLGAIGMAAILWLGGKDVVTGQWTTGAFFAFIGSALSLYQPVKNFSRSNATLQQALAGADRIFELLDVKPTVVSRPDAETLPPFEKTIQFRGVGFSYRPDTPVIQDIDVTINKGDILALVGPSGSGKTTFSALVLRFYDPTRGQIVIDGKDLRDVSLDSLRRQIGVVTQETILFNDTVRHNVAYSLPGAGEQQIIEALKTANAWDFVKAMPQQLDTLIGERGVLLSGGQKQRLAIARALLKNPPILILDEATSSLDAASEKLVQDAIEKLMQNRTVIVIAHRLATVKNANRILLLDHGRVAESGTHAELLEKRGLYYKLHELQLLSNK
ncbi:MAG TPA: ABC transporter ATP-binding protein [Elusimicrobiota bacterium]|nr:ABC transporter ATP-binding protein [Elusimicrobiota bacterium]